MDELLKKNRMPKPRNPMPQMRHRIFAPVGAGGIFDDAKMNPDTLQDIQHTNSSCKTPTLLLIRDAQPIGNT
jgi:hypothetical protein